jgi:hypothetical protein
MQSGYTGQGLENGACRRTLFMFIKSCVMLAAVLMLLGSVAACSPRRLRQAP